MCTYGEGPQRGHQLTPPPLPTRTTYFLQIYVFGEEYENIFLDKFSENVFL